jgi:hypothetical protein
MRTRTPQRTRRAVRLVDRDVVVVVVAAAVAMAATLAVTRPPDTVDRLTIRNDTPWHLTLSLGSGSNDPTSPLPVVLAGSTTDVADVLDQGEQWVVHVQAGGVDAGTIEVPRSRLARDWTVVIPERVRTVLAAAKVPLPAS